VFEIVNPDGTLTDVGKWQIGREESRVVPKLDTPKNVEPSPHDEEMGVEDHVPYAPVLEYTGPSIRWTEEVNAVMDELAEMLGRLRNLFDHCFCLTV
jgi:hypothetical protein